MTLNAFDDDDNGDCIALPMTNGDSTSNNSLAVCPFLVSNAVKPVAKMKSIDDGV